MKWIKYVVIAGWLCQLSVVPSMSWGQTRPRPEPAEGTASLEGTVRDAETKKPIVGAVVTAKNGAGAVGAQQSAAADGSFQLILDPKQQYIITTKADGYSTLDEPLAFTSGSTNRLYGKVIRLFRIRTIQLPTAAAPVSAGTATGTAAATARPAVTPPVSESTAVRSNAAPGRERVTPPKTLDAKVTYTPPLLVATPGKVTQMRAIQFVQSKAELLPNAQPALDQLLTFMRDKPTVEIELAGHTDNQGDFDQNLRLSKERVEVVKAYLVQNGIPASRIATRGYGPTRPIASNNFESTRQLNRRVELIVVKE